MLTDATSERSPNQTLPTATWRAVLFDLDGTLLDTLHDIADSANAVLAGHGFPTYAATMYRQFVGEGVATLLARALPADCRDPQRIAQYAAEFREVYGQKWNVHTQPYEGIVPLLDKLSAEHVPMAVLSNKPDEFTQKCVRQYLPRAGFAAVVGQRDTHPRKPDPTAALALACQLSVPADQFLYLGDSAVDMETARRAGMQPIGAGWGFRSRQELRDGGAAAIIDHPLDLLEISTKYEGRRTNNEG